MSSPVVESVRAVPLNVEKDHSRNHIPMEIEASGFPFEREPDRDGHFRSQLDDIAKRHPEFAEHLGNFSRRRQSSGGEAEDFHRRFERPFASGHFDRFGGFPFDRDNFDPEQYAQQFYQQQPEYEHPQPQSYQHQYSYQPQYQYQPQPQEYQQCPPQQQQQQQGTEDPSAPEYARASGNIQQSNTTDLGQKQEPVNERNQRSMSAPPAEKAQRFTSSIKIPVNQPQPDEGDDMAQTQSPQQTDGKTTERIIPIHIEGRDEPVLPKTAPPTYSQPQQTYAGPQPERIFGQRPEHFTQFVNREPRQFDKWNRPGFDQMHQGFVPEEKLRQQRYPQQNVPPYYQQQQQPQRPAPQQHQQHVPPHPQAQPREDIPIHVQREAPQTKQHVPPQQQAAPPQPPQPKPAPQQNKPKTPIDQIQDIQKDVSDLMIQVEQFTGKPKDKQYLYLDEMLTRNLLKLDNVDTQGQEAIRSARKEAIKCIEKTISVLEAKAAGNVEAPKAEENMEVEEKAQEAAREVAEGENKPTEVQTMEAEPASENKVEGNELQPMEFSPESVANPEQAPCEEKKEEEKAAVEAEPQPVNPVIENRAVLVTTEDKEVPKVEGGDKTEPMETKEEPPVVAAAAEPKPEVTTCEGQESNLPVAEAVKKFDGKEEEIKPEENKEGAQAQQEEKKVEDKPEEKPAEEKKEEKKEKKKGKKKVEKKEK